MTTNGPDRETVAKLSARLHNCYDRMAAIPKTMENSEALLEIAKEADPLMMALCEALAGSRFPEQVRAELSDIKQKIDALIRLLRQELTTSRARMDRLHQGRQAIKGYGPIRYGMGYTEGKFIDSKK